MVDVAELDIGQLCLRTDYALAFDTRLPRFGF